MPLGLAYRRIWAHDPAETSKPHTCRQRATADTESQRWLDAHASTDSGLLETTRVALVVDRRADLVGRFATHHRRLDRLPTGDAVEPTASPTDPTAMSAPEEFDTLAARVRAAPVLGRRTVAIQGAVG